MMRMRVIKGRERQRSRKRKKGLEKGKEVSQEKREARKPWKILKEDKR